MDAGEALLLIVELVEVLDAAEAELVQLEATEMPVSDRLLGQLEDGDAMKRMLTRLIDESANSAKMRERAQALYREERVKACRTDSTDARVPVTPDVLRQLAEAREIIRRRALVDGDLGHELDGALLRSAFADC